MLVRSPSLKMLKRNAGRRAMCSLRVTAFLLALCFVSSAAHTAGLSEQQKIDALLESLTVLPGAVFIRNGVAYQASEAVDHLRRKLHRAGNRVKTAEDFITCCAIRSSMSGEPYRIKFPDGRVVTAETHFRQTLEALIGTGR